MIHGANPVLAAKYAHLTSRPASQLAKGQAHIACVATLLRWIYSVITSRAAWDRRIAAGTSPVEDISDVHPDSRAELRQVHGHRDPGVRHRQLKLRRVQHRCRLPGDRHGPPVHEPALRALPER